VAVVAIGYAPYVAAGGVFDTLVDFGTDFAFNASLFRLAELVAYKVITVSIALAALMKMRRRRAGEATAWLLAVVMIALTLHWYQYNLELAGTVDYGALASQIRLAAAPIPGG